jgi:hypothetical protein
MNDSISKVILVMLNLKSPAALASRIRYMTEKLRRKGAIAFG